MQDGLLKHQPDPSRARRFHSNLKFIAGLERFAVIQFGPGHQDEDALHLTFVISHFQAQAKRHSDAKTHSSLVRISIG